LILKIVRGIKAHIQSNLKVPHPTLVAFGISAAITFVVFGLFYTADTGIMGIVDAEAAPKFKPCNGGC
jgi:hypothetical protein